MHQHGRMWCSPFDPNIGSCSQTDTCPMETLANLSSDVRKATQLWSYSGLLKSVTHWTCFSYWICSENFFWTFCARTEAGRICILSCRHVPYQARSLSTSDTSHDVSFHSMHKIMCLVVCRRSLIDFIAVMKENLLRFRTWAFWCEVYLDLAAYSVSLWFACQFLTSCTLQTLCWLRRRKWWRREQCEPKMDLMFMGPCIIFIVE